MPGSTSPGAGTSQVFWLKTRAVVGDRGRTQAFGVDWQAGPPEVTDEQLMDIIRSAGAG